MATNPTTLGLPPGAAALPALTASGDPVYRPRPLGLQPARAAVARHAGRQGRRVDPERVVLTASTSEAYGYLFKLLCDPGDTVLLPAPGYPLFEHLTGLEGVQAGTYRLCLEAGGGWSLDMDRLRADLTPETRVLVLISPHNPTGWRLPESQRREILALAAERRVAVVVDEVFADFAVDEGARHGPAALSCLAAGADTGLWFTLGGLSKSAGLPQMKVAWFVVGGQPSLVDDAMDRLAVIADAYLSVATPAQLALPAWLEAAGAFRRAVRERLRVQRALLEEALASRPEVALLPSAGGWSALLRLPATRTDEDDAVALLQQHDVLVQPGYLFDLPPGTFLVLSLLVPPEDLQAAVPRLLAYLGTR